LALYTLGWEPYRGNGWAGYGGMRTGYSIGATGWESWESCKSMVRSGNVLDGILGGLPVLASIVMVLQMHY